MYLTISNEIINFVFEKDSLSQPLKFSFLLLVSVSFVFTNKFGLVQLQRPYFQSFACLKKINQKSVNSEGDASNFFCWPPRV